MNHVKRACATLLLAGAAVSLATPAMADTNPLSLLGGPALTAPAGALGVLDARTPLPNWTWTTNTRNQSFSAQQNGLLNLANSGNVCVGLLGILAPSTPCTNS
ncbi:hypothetical protein ACFXD5_22640 [Streptomyces sp. NPDC059385]|uniref:hypothetical protein n=1 Tax=Streptomyces sp. NPDC059385 TaxID=3346817 RepID=UPI0036CE1B52